MKELKGQVCPVCHEKTLTLAEDESEVPYFGRVFIFSMNCSNCKWKKSDIEAAEEKEPCKYTLDISSEDDMKIRVVKSSQATIKLLHVMNVEPGPASEGYVTNVEGILAKMKEAADIARDAEEEESDKKKAKNLSKKLTRIMWGQEPAKLILEDPTGNSAIISEKAVKGKLK